MRPFPLLDRYRHDQSAATAIEYALITAIISLALVGIAATGGAVESLYNVLMAIADAISGTGSGSGGGGG